jgi:hypothetical protein
LFIALALAMLADGPVRAVIFSLTGDPTYNTSAPAGSVAAQGWSYEGQIDGYMATPIAPTFIISAKHIGSTANQDFVFNGRTYKTISYFDCPNSDLRVLQVDQTFPYYAPLYTNSNETGLRCVVIGRGTERGDPVIVNGVTNGWKWGARTAVQRWGENDVQTIYTDPDLGQFLYCTFDRHASSNECALTDGDSGGATFIQDGGQWKLAGIHMAVDGPFSTDGTTNTQFNAAFLNAQGFYYLNGSSQWQLITAPTPSGFYSSRISAHLDWIHSVINDLPGDDFRFTGVTRSGDDLEIALLTAAGRQYRVDYSTNLSLSTWTAVTNVTATAAATTVVDPGAAALSTRRFYRLLLLK